MNWLKEEVRAKVRPHGMRALGDTMKLARKVEKNKALGRGGDGPTKRIGSVGE